MSSYAVREKHIIATLLVIFEKNRQKFILFFTTWRLELVMKLLKAYRTLSCPVAIDRPDRFDRHGKQLKMGDSHVDVNFDWCKEVVKGDKEEFRFSPNQVRTGVNFSC